MTYNGILPTVVSACVISSVAVVRPTIITNITDFVIVSLDIRRFFAPLYSIQFNNKLLFEADCMDCSALTSPNNVRDIVIVD